MSKVSAIGCGPKGCRPVSFEAPDVPRGHPPGRCKHFTGLFGPGAVKHETCAAGVRYRDVRLEHDPIPYVQRGVTYRAGMSLPCLAGPGANLAGATCAEQEWPTEEEAAEHDTYMRKLGAALSDALTKDTD